MSESVIESKKDMVGFNWIPVCLPLVPSCMYPLSASLNSQQRLGT